MQPGKLRRTEKGPSETWASEDQGETLSLLSHSQPRRKPPSHTPPPSSFCPGKGGQLQEGGMHAGLRANLSFFMPVAWGGPSPSTVIHSLGCLGSVSIPFSSSVPGLFLKRSKLHRHPHSQPHTHTIFMYTLVSLGRPYEMLVRESVSDNLGLLEKAENCLLCTGEVQLLADWGGTACTEEGWETGLSLAFCGCLSLLLLSQGSGLSGFLLLPSLPGPHPGCHHHIWSGSPL